MAKQHAPQQKVVTQTRFVFFPSNSMDPHSTIALWKAHSKMIQGFGAPHWLMLTVIIFQNIGDIAHQIVSLKYQLMRMLKEMLQQPQVLH